jgi:hypothetical protein
MSKIYKKNLKFRHCNNTYKDFTMLVGLINVTLYTCFSYTVISNVIYKSNQLSVKN